MTKLLPFCLRAPLIRVAAFRFSDTLNHRRRLGIVLLRPRNGFSLGRQNSARTCRIRLSHRVVALLAAFNEQLIFIHAIAPIFCVTEATTPYIWEVTKRRSRGCQKIFYACNPEFLSLLFLIG